jgi:hypothetical protein
MEFLLKTALTDTAILSAALFLLVFVFLFLAKNMAEGSFLATFKKNSKHLVLFSFFGIVSLGLMTYAKLNLGFVGDKIFLIVFIILPFLVLFVSSVATLFAPSGRNQLLSIVKNRFVFALIPLLAGAVKLFAVAFGIFAKLILTNLPEDDSDYLREKARREEEAHEGWLAGRPGYFSSDPGAFSKEDFQRSKAKGN